MSELEENKQKLFTACKFGDKCLLIKLAREGITPSAYDMVDSERKTPLHIACRYGHIIIVRMLIEAYNCSLKAVDNSGLTPCHDACFYDQVLILDYLIHISTECLLAVDFNGNTPFHKANQSGSLQVIKYILHLLLTGSTPTKICAEIAFKLRLVTPSRIIDRNKYYYNKRNNVGDTPLEVACRHGHLGTIKMYKIVYHHILGRKYQSLFSTQTLLKIAIQCGHVEIVYFLRSITVSLGTAVSKVRTQQRLTDHMYDSDFHYVRDIPERCTSCLGIRTPMHDFDISVKVQHVYWNKTRFQCVDSDVESFCMAVLLRNEDIIAKFLASQEGMFQDSDCTNICLAACIAENIDILKQHLSDNMVLRCGNTLLHIACEWGSKTVAEYIITTEKCDLNATNDYGETPLHTACRHNKAEIVQLFSKTCQYEMFNKLNQSSESPLHLACLHSDSAAANLILDVGKHFNLDISDKFGDTPLMNACLSGNVHLVERLMEMGCNPLYINSVSKEMPVHVACRMQKLDILKILLNGFDGRIDQHNLFGETPLCIALNASCIAIVRFLVQRGLCDVTLSLRQCVPDIECKDDCVLPEHDQCTDSEALLSQMPYYDEPTRSAL